MIGNYEREGMMTVTESEITAADLFVGISNTIADSVAKAEKAATQMLVDLVDGKDPADAYDAAQAEIGDRWSTKLPYVQADKVLQAAWHAFNVGRRDDGLVNPMSPLNRPAFALAEQLLDGEDAPATQPKAAGSRYALVSPQVVAVITVRVANANIDRLVPVKTKVDGKVTYRARPVRPLADPVPGGPAGGWTIYGFLPS